MRRISSVLMSGWPMRKTGLGGLPGRPPRFFPGRLPLNKDAWGGSRSIRPSYLKQEIPPGYSPNEKRKSGGEEARDNKLPSGSLFVAGDFSLFHGLNMSRNTAPTNRS